MTGSRPIHIRTANSQHEMEPHPRSNPPARAVAGIHDLVGVSWLLKRKLPATAPLP
jgi:hypothetical protein